MNDLTHDNGQRPEDEKETRAGEDDYTRWVSVAISLCKVVLEPPMAGSPVRVPSDLADAARVLMFHFGRAFRTFQALGLLLREGYTQDALVLLRTFLEVFFEMAFIAKRPEDAHFYLEHATALYKAWQDKAKPYAPPFMLPLLGLARAVDGKASAGRLPHSAWHPVFRSVRQRAREAGVPDIYYDLVYGLGSRYVHGSGDWLQDIAEDIPGGIQVSYGADRTERNLVMCVACDAFIQILSILHGCLEIPIGRELEAVRAEFDEVAKGRADSLAAKYGDTP